MGTVEHDLEESESAASPELHAAGPKDTPSMPAPGALPMDKRAIYTMVAHQGVNAAEMLNNALSAKTVGKNPPRRVDVAAPDGPSTDGGKRARQIIRLVPASGSGGIVVCGALDVAQRTLELRTYRNACAQHIERYGTKFDVSPEDYAKLLKELGAMVHALQFTVSVLQDTQGSAGETGLGDEEDALPAGLPRAAPNKKLLLFLAAAISVGVVIGLLIPTN